MTLFADSSALVKRYADEDDVDLVRAVPVSVVSAIARVEVPATRWRKQRTGQLSVQDAGVLTAGFAADWHEPGGPFVAVALHPGALERAAGLVAAHSLRAYDAVQLACAVAARAADGQIDSFLCFDSDLRTAAAREGFTLPT